MIIDVSSVLKEFGGKLDVSGEIALGDMDFLGGLYHFDAPVSINGNISNNGQSLIFRAGCKGVMRTQCARCMKDIDVDIEFDIDEVLIQDDGTVSEESEAILFEGYTVDIDDIAANSFLMNVQSKYLCSDDCKGLCRICGADLNEGECGCNREEIDPRWAALADLIKDNN